MGSATPGLGGTASGASPEPTDATDNRLISLPGRSPVLDAAQLGVLRGYGSERDVAAGDVLFADGDETYDLIVLLAGTADIIEAISNLTARQYAFEASLRTTASVLQLSLLDYI